MSVSAIQCIAEPQTQGLFCLSLRNTMYCGAAHRRLLYVSLRNTMYCGGSSQGVENCSPRGPAPPHFQAHTACERHLGSQNPTIYLK